MPIIHDMHLFKKWFVRSSKWLFISILFSISPFTFQANKTKVIWKENLHVHCSTDPNSLDRNFFQDASWMSQGMKWWGKNKFLKFREKSGNFTSSQENFKSLKDVREQWSFKSAFCTFYRHESCYIVHEIEEQADVGFSRRLILFALYVKKLPVHVHCMCLAESIN